MPHYYLTPYTGVGTKANPFRPVGTQSGWAGIDLRASGLLSIGWCFMSLPNRVDPSGAAYYGSNLDAVLSNTQRSDIAAKLGASFSGTTLRQIIPEVLLQGLNDGTRWRPLRAGKIQHEVWLGERIWTQPRVAGGATITDDFNVADTGTLSGDLTWTEVLGDWSVSSNAATCSSGGTALARADSDLDSDDHYAQAQAPSAPNSTFAVCVRFSSSATTCYYLEIGSTDWQLYKCEAGSFTSVSGPTAITPSAPSFPGTLKLQADGSTLKGYWAGTEQFSLTDTSITGHLRGGMGSFAPSSITKHDNFEAGDIIPPAVSFVAASAWAAGTTSVTPSMPTGWAAGDKLIIFVCNKPDTVTPTTPTGWNQVGTVTGGTGSQGVDTGPCRVTAYERTAQSGDTAPSITLTSNNVCLARMAAWRKPSGNTWATVVGAGGGDTTSGTGFSITGGSDPGFAAGDFADVGFVISGNNVTFGATPTLSATGATFTGITKAPSSDGTTNNGNDLASSAFYAEVTAGPSSAAPVAGSTLSGNQAGAGYIVRIRSTAAGTTYTKSVDGAVTPTGARAGRVNRAVSGATSPTGAAKKQANRALAGSVSPAAAITKRVNRSVTGAVSPAGALASVRIFVKTAGGAISPTAIIAKRVNRSLVGAVSPTSTQSRSLTKRLTGAISPTAALLKRLNRSVSGATTPSGALITARNLVRSFAGAITPSGAATKRPNRAVTGAVTPSATLSRQNSRTLSGSVSPSGGIAKRVARTVTGSITPSGALAKLLSRALSGSITPSGTATKQVNRRFTGSASPTGAVVKVVSKVFGGAVTPMGMLTSLKSYLRAFSGSATPSGSAANQVNRTVTGATTPIGTGSKIINRAFGGSTTPSGTFSGTLTMLQRAFSGEIGPIGAISKRISAQKGGSTVPTGSLARISTRTVSGSVSPAAIVARVVGKALTGSVAPSGGLLRLTTRVLDGSVSPVGVATKLYSKAFSGSIGFIGGVLRVVNRLVSGSATPTGIVLNEPQYTLGYPEVESPTYLLIGVGATEIVGDRVETFISNEQVRLEIDAGQLPTFIHPPGPTELEVEG